MPGGFCNEYHNENFVGPLFPHGMVYFIYEQDSNIVKIGKTEGMTPEKRFKTLQASNGRKLEVFHLSYIFTDWWSHPLCKKGNNKWNKVIYKLEDCFHEIFKKNRLHGEWFEIPRKKLIKEVLEFEDEMTKKHIEIKKSIDKPFLI